MKRKHTGQRFNRSVATLACALMISGLFAGCGSSTSMTGTGSHIHALLVENDGSLIMGNQSGLYHGVLKGKTYKWTAFGAPLNQLMPRCVAQVWPTTNPLQQPVLLAGTTKLSVQVIRYSQRPFPEYRRWPSLDEARTAPKRRAVSGDQYQRTQYGSCLCGRRNVFRGAGHGLCQHQQRKYMAAHPLSQLSSGFRGMALMWDTVFCRGCDCHGHLALRKWRRDLEHGFAANCRAAVAGCQWLFSPVGIRWR